MVEAFNRLAVDHSGCGTSAGREEGHWGDRSDADTCTSHGSVQELLMGSAVVEIVLAELIETVALWVAGEVHAGGSDGLVAGRFLRECALRWGNDSP